MQAGGAEIGQYTMPCGPWGEQPRSARPKSMNRRGQSLAARFAEDYTFNTLRNICGFQSFHEAAAMLNMLDIRIETRRFEFLML